MADCATCDPSKIMHVSVISVFAFLALMSLIFRLWARMIKRNRLEWNDYLCVGGLVFIASSEEFVRHAKLTSGLYTGFDLCFSPLYACFITLDALCSDILFSVCLLGLFLEECRGRFRHCSPSIQGSWYSLMPRSSEFTKKHKGFARRATSLDHRRDTDSRISPLLVQSNFLHEVLSHRVLWDSLHQFGLLHSNSAGMLSNMPTLRFQLGPVHTRVLWRPKVSRSIHWSLQFIDGHHNRRITNARLMGASNADRNEDCFERTVFNGYSVRATLLLPFLFSGRSAT